MALKQRTNNSGHCGVGSLSTSNTFVNHHPVWKVNGTTSDVGRIIVGGSWRGRLCSTPDPAAGDHLAVSRPNGQGGGFMVS
jgi:hypothetical protein